MSSLDVDLYAICLELVEFDCHLSLFLGCRLWKSDLSGWPGPQIFDVLRARYLVGMSRWDRGIHLDEIIRLDRCIWGWKPMGLELEQGLQNFGSDPSLHKVQDESVNKRAVRYLCQSV